NFTVYVPAGTYTLDFSPPRCRAVTALRLPDVVIAANTNLGTLALGQAVLVSGVVHDHAGLPVVDAKLKFYDVKVAGVPRVGAANDHTDATGAFSIYMAVGRYDINVEPPVGLTDLVLHLNSEQVNSN